MKDAEFIDCEGDKCAHYGIGPDAFQTKGYTFPTTKQQNKFDKYGIVHDIDSEIRDAVIDLHDAGYRTGGSCQGHAVGARGYVSINPHPSELPKPFIRRVAGYYKTPVSEKRVVSDLYNLGGDRGATSTKPVDPREVKGILKDNGISPTRHNPPNWDQKGDLICKQQYHSFNFPALTPGRRY
jgi:hypothetical protein